MMKFCLIVLLLFVAAECDNHGVPQIEIEQGTLAGKYLTSRKGRTFSAFTAIPYAKPPIGELRFKAPVAAGPWEGIFDASKSHDSCPQTEPFFGNGSVFGNEDCLYLNVYTPTNLSSSLLPVMFFIHGGGFIFWSGKQEVFGPDLLLDKDIVLVIPNYRLGALGFLSTGDEIVPVNNGLKDQNLAIKWTKKNIAHFGGDPDCITLFGESAGAASVQHHVASPLSRDLIKGAIAQSGSAIGLWGLAIGNRGTKNSKRLAELLSCPANSSIEMVECLKSVDAHEIVLQQDKFAEFGMISFQPVIEPNIDGAFLAEHPIDIYKSGKAANIPFMTGLNTEEGAFISADTFRNSNLLDELSNEFNRIAPKNLGYKGLTSNDDYVTEEIRKFYFGDKKIDNSSRVEVTNMYSDVMMLMSEDSAVRLHLRYVEQPVYYYLFGYRASVSFADYLGDSSHDYGVSHCDDLLHLFNFGVLPTYKLNEFDERVTDIILTLWTNFAKTGNPTPETTSQLLTKWEPVAQNESLKLYFIKNDTDLNMVDDVFATRVKFWNSLPINVRGYHIEKEL